MKQRRMWSGASISAVLLSALAAGQAAPKAPAKGARGGQTAQAPRFEVDPLWPRPLPNRWILGSAVGVATDARDHVFVLNRQDSFNQRTEIGAATNPKTGECCSPAPSVLEFDPLGNLVAHWGGPGDGYEWPTAPTRITIDDKGNVWIAGSGGTDSQILEFSHDGKFLKQIGKAGHAPAAAPAVADTAYAGASGRAAAGGGRGGGRGRGRGAPAYSLPPNSASTEDFGGAAKISFDAKGAEAYVADGYRNRRVAVLDMNTGALKRFWGAYGNKPDDAKLAPYTPDASPAQQFGTPVHCAEPSNDGLVYVCDRSNDRVQVFRKDGSFIKEKVIAPTTRGDGSVWDITFSRDPQQTYLYVADGMNMKIYVLDRQSLELLTMFGDGGRQPGEFYAVHSITTDSKGNLYTAETYEGKRVQKFVYKGVGPVMKSDEGVLWPRAGGKP